MYPGVSPYVYTLQNPVRYVDPTGMYVESPDDIRIWGKDNEGNEVLLVNLVTDKVDADIITDIEAPEGIGFVTKGHDPITNKENENKSGALLEYDIDKLIPGFFSNIPENGNLILSIGTEASFLKGVSSSIDLTFFQNDRGMIDAIGTYLSEGKGWGASADLSLQAGFVISRNGSPLSLRSFEGASTVTSLSAGPLGGTLINSDVYSGRTSQIIGLGGGFSRMNVNSTLMGGWGNLNQYLNR